MTSLVSAIVGLTMVLSLVVGVGSAKALTASELMNLLIAAGVIAPDKVAAAQAALGATTVTATSGYNFTRDLQLGAKGDDVTALQNMLIGGGYMASGYPLGYFGGVTKAALIKFQLANGIKPAAGYFGAITRAKIASVNTATGNGNVTADGGATTTGTDLAVTLAASSPMASAIVAGQAAADLAEFTFTNNTATPAVVTNVSFARLGVSSDTSLSNVYLYNGAMRLTDAASVSSGKITFNAGNGLFTVPANSSYTIAVKADIASATNGQQVVVALTGVTSNVTLNASLPISGATMSIFLASDIAGVTIGTVTSPATTTQTGVTVQAGTLNSTIWSAPLTVSTRAINLKSVAFKVIGSIPSNSLQNIKLYASGIQVASATGVDSNGMITFDLSAAPYKIDSNRTLEVRADVMNGSGRTFSVSLQNIADLAVIDSSYNVGIAASSGIPATTGTVTITNGSVTVTLDSTLGSQNVVAGSTNVPLARYTMKAYGEDEKISYIYATVNRTTDNIALYANGVQIGSTQSVTANVAKLYSLGSSLIIPAGTTVALEIRGDLKNAGTNFATGTTVIATLTGYTSNAQGSYSSTLTTVPSSAITGPTMTVSGVGVVVAKNASVADYTTVANTTGQKIGSFILQTNSSEAAKVTSLTVALGGTLPYATSLSNLYIAVAGQSPTTPIAPQASNNFSTNFTIPANSSQIIDVYADVGAVSGTTNAANTTTGTLTQSTTTAGVTAVAGAYATGTVSIETTTTSVIGQVYSITIAGYPSSYTVAASAATTTDIATGLINAINANNNVNGTVTASNLAGTTTVVLITANNKNTNTVTLSSTAASTTANVAALAGGAAATAAGYQVVRVTPAGSITIGNVFTVVVSGLSISYTATAATVANVTAGLTAAINASSSVAAIVTASDVGTWMNLTAVAATTAAPVITSSVAAGTQVTSVGVTNTASTTLTATGYGVNSNATVSGSATGQTVTVGSGSLDTPTLKTGSGYTPDAQFVVGGTSSVIAYFNFISNNNAAIIEEIYFNATGSSVVAGDAAITSVTVGGATFPVVGGLVTATGLNITVPTGYAGYNLPVTATFNTVGIGGVTTGKTIGLTMNGFKYKTGNTETTVGATTANNNLVTTNNNWMTIVSSKPTITLANASDTTVGGGGVVEVARITISADAKGPIKVNAIPLSQIMTGSGSSATTTTVKVGSSNIAITDGFAATVGTTTAVTGTLTITNGYDIAAGSSVTFSIYKNVTLTNANLSLDTIRTTLGSSANFVWTDVNGNATTTGAMIYGYPTNVAVTSY